MAPRILHKSDVAYECVRELDFAIGSKDCNNIALTGIYGSGKSSIIKTLLHKHPFKKVLKLSLSRYISKEEIENFNEQEVERSIFQHILYKSKPQNTPQSKYRRISHVSYTRAFFYAVSFILVIWSCLTLWKPEWLELGVKSPFTGESAQQFLLKVAEWKNAFAVTFVVIALVIILVHLIRRLSKFGIHSIKYKDISFDVVEEGLDFNKLLEELLYFLKAGRYQIVVFEDLDRIKNPKELFLKFREINLLLNESEYYLTGHKRIIFIYAIRDDVFQEEERTKFFDYIVPVIPVVDHFNASDYLLKNYKHELDEIDDKDIMTLGLYIGGMRQLLNIMNEYGVYKRMILRKPLSQKKLLAMTIYKNLYPEDYSLTHSKKGCLFGIFDRKKEFSHLLTEVDEKNLEDLSKQIDEIRASVLKQRKILSEWAHKNGNITALIINEERYRLDDVIERDDLYQQVEANAVEGYIEEEEGQEYRNSWTYSFNDIVKEIDEDGTYGETMEELDRKLYKLVATKNTIQKRIQTTINYSLQRIILTVNNSDKTLEIATVICENDSEKAKVLHSLIRNGYVDDDYKAYLSFTYPGAMTSTDFEFVHSVLQGVEADYYAELEGFDQILKALHTNNFSQKSILNYSLLKYIIAQKDEVRLEPFVKTARKEPYFIVSAFLHEEVDEEFYRKVFEGWNHCIREILKITSDSDQKTMLMLFWQVAPQGLILDNDEKSFLNGMYGAVHDNLPVISEDAAIKVIKEYDLRFEKIRRPDDTSKKLFKYVLEHSCFTINTENLLVIYGDDFMNSSYTQVIRGKKEVLRYINNNITEFIRLIPESDVRESKDAIVEVLNDKALTQDDIKQFVGRQENKLDNLDSVNATSYGLLFELDKIEPTWNSIVLYYTTCPEDTEQVVQYIKRNIQALEGSKVQEEEMELQTLLLTTNETLTVEEYEKLAKCFEEPFEVSELENLDDDRLRIIIKNDLVGYSKETVDFFIQKSMETLAFFIIHFFNELEKDADLNITFSNELSLKLLDSDLAIEQKKWLLDNQITINDEDGKQELVKKICFYSEKVVLDKNSDVDMIVDAMQAYADADGWKVKIDLTNAINAAFTYNATLEERMLNSLGGGYLGLNRLGGAPIFFDKNEENEVLLNYLKGKGHNVNRVIPEENRLKVTFKKK